MRAGTWASFLLMGIASLTYSAPIHSQTNSDLGTNLSEVTDYSHQLPFNNIFLFSRKWLTQCSADSDPGCSDELAFNTGEDASLDLDPSGWIRSLPAPSAQPIFTRAATIWDVPSDFPRGEYLVLYDGEGVIEYDLGARKNVAKSTKGRDLVDVSPESGAIVLRIIATDPANYIRNIRMVEVSAEPLLATTPFRPQFVDRLRPYKALRFMDWMRTNNSPQSNWNLRARPNDARYSTEKGVPAEIMIELSNTTGKNPWFTIPHLADDSYVESFASLTKELLAPSLQVYLEYSNEAWNSVFSQGAFIEQQGLLEWPNVEASAFTKRINWYGKRSAQICQIWKRVFAESSGRVTCVMASQAANSWTATEALTCPLWNSGPCIQHGISALAIAPYFGDYLGGDNYVAEVSSWAQQGDAGIDKLFAEIQLGGALTNGPRGGALEQSMSWIEQNRAVATSFALQLVSYEGGQHLVGVGAASARAPITKLFTSSNRDPRMGDTYFSYLNGWRERGGGLFMHFTDISSYSVFGSWGALEGVGDTQSPKYNALLKFAGLTPSDSTPPTPQLERTIAVMKRGSGMVESSPKGISCGSTCRYRFQTGSQVKLIAKPSRSSRFTRWIGGCKHSKPTCRVRIRGDMRITAVFQRRPMTRSTGIKTSPKDPR
jgi:hypothetical protein